MKAEALVFDLDDTLYAERDFVLSGFAAVDGWLQQRRGVTGFAAEAQRVFATGVRGRIFDDVLDHLGVTHGADLIPEMVAVYREHRPALTLFPEALPVINGFRGRLRLGLLTDGYRQTQRNKVAALGIAGLFDLLIYTDDLGRENWKPSPVPFERMMAGLGCAGERCVYVGDNPTKDFLAPNRLDWLTVQILRESGEYGRVGAPALEPAFQAKRVIRSLGELDGILN
jgi:putative hydrolase of the HAD superfamily